MTATGAYLRCDACGHHNRPDATFCENPPCQQYLPHSDSVLVDGTPEDRSRPDGAHAAPVAGPPDTAGGPAGGPVDGPASGAASGTASGPAPAPAAQQPRRTPESSPPAAPPEPAAERERIEPGQRVCGECGTGNDPERHFCRRCGSNIDGAPVAPAERRPWWRRFRRRERGPRPAGSRPRRRHRRRVPWVPVVLVAVLAGAGWVFRSELADGVAWARGRAEPVQAVRPVTVEVSAGADTGELAFDGTTNLAWRPGPGPSDGASMTVELGQPVRLDSVIVTPGVSTVPEEFLANYRPRDLQVELVDATGEVVATSTEQLRDEAGPQRLAVGGPEVSTVRLTVLSVYGTQGDLAVAEIELFGR